MERARRRRARHAARCSRRGGTGATPTRAPDGRRPCMRRGGARWPRAGVLTISPDGDGTEDCAALRFRLSSPSAVEFVVLQRKPRPGVVHVERLRAASGLTTVVWAPAASTAARTYVTRLSLTGAARRPDDARGPGDPGARPGGEVRAGELCPWWSGDPARWTRCRGRCGWRSSTLPPVRSSLGPRAVRYAAGRCAGRALATRRLRRTSLGRGCRGPGPARRESSGCVTAARRRRPTDEHLAGLQPHGRRRRRDR